MIGKAIKGIPNSYMHSRKISPLDKHYESALNTEVDLIGIATGLCGDEARSEAEQNIRMMEMWNSLSEDQGWERIEMLQKFIDLIKTQTEGLRLGGERQEAFANKIVYHATQLLAHAKGEEAQTNEVESHRFITRWLSMFAYQWGDEESLEICSLRMDIFSRMMNLLIDNHGTNPRLRHVDVSCLDGVLRPEERRTLEEHALDADEFVSDAILCIDGDITKQVAETLVESGDEALLDDLEAAEGHNNSDVLHEYLDERILDERQGRSTSIVELVRPSQEITHPAGFALRIDSSNEEEVVASIAAVEHSTNLPTSVPLRVGATYRFGRTSNPKVMSSSVNVDLPLSLYLSDGDSAVKVGTFAYPDNAA